MLQKRSFWAMLTVYMALWLVIVNIAGDILNSYEQVINNALGLTGYRTETIVTEGEDLEYFKSEFVKKDENGNVIYITDENGYVHQAYDDEALRAAAIDAARQVQREGTTILWNSPDTGLPLSEGDKVSVFSRSSVAWGYSGGGSSVSYKGDSVKTVLTDVGLSVNTKLWDFYNNGAGSSYVREGMIKMNEVPWSVYTDEVKESFSSFGDAAIVVLTRLTREGSVGGAGADVTQTSADTPTGDYLDLSYEEEQMIDELIALKNAGTFDKVVVLLNTPASIFMDSLVERKDDIDCCMWVGQTGSQGLNEVGNILVGKSIPSGHLADTFLYDTRSTPVYANSAATMYTNAAEMGLTNINNQGVYMVYAEGIYIGYRYYETRYEDAVLGRGNAASATGAVNSASGWVYGEEVAFPFGYGGAYTTFAYSDYSAVLTPGGDSYTVTLTVTNTGSKAGSDAVQIYVQKPYTTYDKMWGIEESAVNLAGYAKTKMLEPGESQEIVIEVEADAFKTYDAYNKKTYIREKSEGIDAYYITAAQDAHEAVNNILAAKGKTPENTNGVMDAAGNADLVTRFDFDTDDFDTFSISDVTGAPITNRFDASDWNLYENKGSETVTYLSRNDWQATYPTETVKLSMTEGMADDLAYNHEVAVNPDDEMPLYEQEHVFNLVDLMGLEYNHDAWDTLLDQLSIDDQIKLLGSAYFGTIAIDSIAKPADIAANGPLGLRETLKDSGKNTISYPSPTLWAASYNDALIERVGEIMGEEALHSGVTGIYAPGANTHRSSYGSRNWEYYSEDGFLGGMMAKAAVLGIQSKGCYVNMKHCALNDQESYRHGVSIWTNEQAMREIYLKAYEYAVTDADATGMMSAFNRIGTTWSGANAGLYTHVMRGEWGMEGFVLSDSAWQAYMGIIDGVMAGNDCILSNVDLAHYEDAKTNPTVAQAVRESTHRILYVIANSNVMNGISSNTRIYEVDEWWQSLIIDVQDAVKTVTIALFIITVIAFVIFRNGPIVSLGRLKIVKIFSTLITIVVAVAIAGASIIVPNYIKEQPVEFMSEFFGNEDEGGDSEGDSSDEENKIPSLKDQLEGDIVDYKFEAECAEIVSNFSTFIGTDNKTIEETNYPSGGLFVYRVKNATQMDFTFKVTASEDTKAVLTMCMGLREWSMTPADVFDFKVNGEAVEVSTDVVFPISRGVMYFDWTEVEIVMLDLKAGENEIVISKKAGLGDAKGNGLNFDYIELSSAATLEWTKEVGVGHDYEEWTAISAPTFDTAGEIGAYCKTCRDYKTAEIPAISISNGYKKTTETNGLYSVTNWTIEVDGYTYTTTEYNYPEGWADYRFEAECSVIETEQTGCVGTDNKTLAAANYPSGGLLVSKMKNAEEMKLIFNVTSSKNAYSILTMCMGLREWEMVMADVLTLTVNGVEVDVEGVVFPVESNSDLRYFDWTEVQVAIIALQEGENEIVIEKKAGVGNVVGAGLNFDYIGISTTASLQWTSEVGVGHSYNDWTVITEPTLTTAGSASSYCATCRDLLTEELPVISAENGYTKVSVEEGTSFGTATWQIVKGNTALSFNTRNYPDDAKTYIFEAERSTRKGSVSIYNSATSGASAGAYLNNLSGAEWTLTFNVGSDRAAEALLIMRVGCNTEITLADGRTLVVNAEKLTIPSDMVFPKVSGATWAEYEIIPINLVEGRNVIRLSNAGETFVNLDYIALISEAELDWYAGGECIEHTPVTDAAVEPTCTTDGLTEGSHCSVCYEIIVEQQLIEYLGHSDDDRNSLCDTCGIEVSREDLKATIYQFLVSTDKDPFLEENGGSAVDNYTDDGKVLKKVTHSTYGTYYENTYGATFTFVLNAEEAASVDFYLLLTSNKGASSIESAFDSITLNGSTTGVTVHKSLIPDTDSWNVKDAASVLYATLDLKVGRNVIVFTRNQQVDEFNKNLNFAGIEITSQVPVSIGPAPFTYTVKDNDPFAAANGGAWVDNNTEDGKVLARATHGTYGTYYENTYGGTFTVTVNVEKDTTATFSLILTSNRGASSIGSAFTSLTLNGKTDGVTVASSDIAKTASWKTSDAVTVLYATLELKAGTNTIVFTRNAEINENTNNLNFVGIEFKSVVPVKLGAAE